MQGAATREDFRRAPLSPEQTEPRAPISPSGRRPTAENDGDEDPSQALIGWRRLRRACALQATRQWDLQRRLHPTAQAIVAAMSVGLRPHSVAANPKSVNDALGRLRDVGIAWQPEPRRWALSDPCWRPGYEITHRRGLRVDGRRPRRSHGSGRAEAALLLGRGPRKRAPVPVRRRSPRRSRER